MMLTALAREQARRLYRTWAGPDPHSRPQGRLFQTLSAAWRGSRSLYRRWWRSQAPLLLGLDEPVRLTGCGSMTGWALAHSGEVTAVQAWVSGNLIAASVPDHQRTDAETAYPFYPHQFSGFRLCPAHGVLTDGVHPLVIKAWDARGRSVELQSSLTVDRFTMTDDHALYPDFTGSNREYQLWLRKHDRHTLPEIIKGPVISVIMPIYRPRHDHLLDAIASVQQQTYSRWELFLCDDGSGNPLLRKMLTEYAATDARIKVISLTENQGISAATNAGISHSQGDFIAFLDQDDLLHCQALQSIAAQTQESPADVYYTDEDRLDARSRRLNPFFKPAWSPALLQRMMYLGHLCVYRRSILDQAGHCRTSFDGTQDWELALRVTDQPGCRVQHVPGIFYHWRLGGFSAETQNNLKCHERGRVAVEDSLHRQQKKYRVVDGPGPCNFSLRPSPRTPRVSLIIPTRDNPAMLKRCLDSIRTRTEYPDYEIIVVDNGSRQPAALDYLQIAPADRVLTIDEPFNHSSLNNRAAELAAGELILLLNDDTEALSHHWLEAMVEQAQQPDVGAVGAWLIYPDGRTQHAGVMLEEHAVARHYSSAVMLDGLDRGLSLLERDVSALTAACLLVHRQLYLDLGGLDEKELPTSYNDVDFCLRLASRSLRCVITPRAKLIHHESASRRLDDRDDRFRQIIRQRWLTELKNERYWNPQLGQSSDWLRGLAFHWSK